MKHIKLFENFTKVTEGIVILPKWFEVSSSDEKITPDYEIDTKVWQAICKVFGGKERDFKDMKHLQTQMYYNLTEEQQKQLFSRISPNLEHAMERVLVTGIFGPYSLNVLKMICKDRNIQVEF